MCLSILIPIAKMQTLYMHYSTKPDLFTIRRVKIMMDKYINRFSGSPLAYTTAGVFYMLRGLILNNNSDFDNALNNFLESHSIIKRSFSMTYDPLQQVANQQNYEYIIDIYRMQGNYEKVYDFFQEVNYFKCNDDTYTCRSANDLNDLTFEFFFNNYYDGALEVNKVVLNQNKFELNLDDSDIMLANYISALMHMYRAEYDKAIDDINNVFEFPFDDDIYKKWNHTISYSLLSEIYYYLGNYNLASKYYLQYYQLRSTFDFDELAHCYHAYIEELRGNSEKAKDGIAECVEWVKLNKDKIGFYHPFHIFYTYWPLYLYYDKLGQTDKASKYLQMAYEVVGKEKIEKYHEYPERDTHPEFFYCRDIIKAYEISLNQ